MVYVDLQLFPEEVGEGSVGEIQYVAVPHVEHLVEDEHVHRSNRRAGRALHIFLKPMPLSHASTCPKASCCH